MSKKESNDIVCCCCNSFHSMAEESGCSVGRCINPKSDHCGHVIHITHDGCEEFQKKENRKG